MGNMNHPFEARIPAVFIPVSDLKRSVAWYSRLLGLALPETTNGQFHIFRLAENGANLFLERRDPVRASPHVLFSLPAPQVDQTLEYLQTHGIEVVAIDRQPDGSAVQFRDPDGHVLMACDI
jgi:catechol 2,3-dioxygenase-like lactoylglutathione lyase family enzyme